LPVRFVADAMLGRLARSLRILGYDTLYNVSWDDAFLVRLARADDRVLLTCDRELARRSGVSIILIASEVLNEQLAQLRQELSIKFENSSRCPVCNSPVLSVSKEEAWSEVPLYAYINCERFSHCPDCGRYYWPGSQWQPILDSLGKALS
jgi:uncharacterized protein with PIN domain